MSSVNVAVTAVLAGTPAVGPGVLVAGTVSATRGRVVSGATPVVKLQTYGAAIARLVTLLRAAVTVAVYSVSGLSWPLEGSVRVATRPEGSRLTVPVGLVQGAAQVTKKL